MDRPLTVGPPIRQLDMCHVIVTCRSMLWTLLSIIVAFAELITFMSPDWLMGFPRSGSDAGADSREYRPSLGLYSRCLRIGSQGVGVSCGPYAGTFTEVASGFWQAAMLFLAAGTLVLGGVACISIFSLCFQSILKKSLFNICGLLQAIAGKTTEAGGGGWGVGEFSSINWPLHHGQLLFLQSAHLIKHFHLNIPTYNQNKYFDF